MRVLILGGTGFIGGALTKHYKEKGCWVKTLGRGRHGNPDIKCSLENIAEEVVNFDLIFDCASTVNDYGLLRGSDSDIETNVLGTHVFLEACRTFNPWARIVYVSTFFVVGDPPNLPANEETVCRPRGIYGATKLCAEQMCRVYADTFDLNVSIARGTNVYGPGQTVANQQTAAFNWMVKTCVENGTIPLYDGGEVQRDYLYIDDAASAICAVAERGRKGETYFFGSGIPRAFKDMTNMMMTIAGGGNVQEVPSPAFHQRVGIKDFWVDLSKMVLCLKWVPKTSMMDGISGTVEWYRDAK